MTYHILPFCITAIYHTNCTTYSVVDFTISAYSTDILNRMKIKASTLTCTCSIRTVSHCVQIWFTCLAVSCNYSYYRFRVQITDERGIKTEKLMHPKCQSENKDCARRPLYISNRGKALAKQVPTHRLNHSDFPNDEQTLLLTDQVKKQRGIST